MSDSSRPVTRRALLGSVASMASVPLAGCGCHGVPPQQDHLDVTVREIRRSGDGYGATLSVSNDGDDPEEASGTHYRDVVVLAYDPDRERVARLVVGDLEPGDSTTETITTNRFPFVLTADAGGLTTPTEEDCEGSETGALVRGYVGYFSEETPDLRDEDGRGHVWQRTEPRSLSDPLPPGTRHFEWTKCRHREYLRQPDRPDPNLSLLEATPWLDRDVRSPQVTRLYRITAGGTATEDQRRRFLDPDARRPLATFPEPVREAVRSGSTVGEVDSETFFRYVSEIEGREVTKIADLPPCHETYVHCFDSRGEHCPAGGGQFVGIMNHHVWYFAEYDDDLYPVVAFFEENRNPERRSADWIPCKDEKREEFGVYVHLDREARDDEAANASRAESVPPVIADRIQYSRDRPEALHMYYLPKAEWTAAIAALEGEGDPRLPTCARGHVDCNPDYNAACEGQHRSAFYEVADGDASVLLEMRYHWESWPRPPDETNATPPTLTRTRTPPPTDEPQNHTTN